MGNQQLGSGIRQSEYASSPKQERGPRTSTYDNDQVPPSRTTTTINNKFSLVICRNSQGKFLAVKEVGIRGWWIPGGHVERRENFVDTAKRKTLEQAGIEVNIVAVIRFQYAVLKNGEERQRVIFYAEPKDESLPLKRMPDRESEFAQWVDLEQFACFKPIRGPQLIQFGRYVEQGGPLYPLSICVHELKEVQPAHQIYSEMKALEEMQQKRKIEWTQQKKERIQMTVKQGMMYGKYLHELQQCKNKILLQIKNSKVPLQMEDIDKQARILWEKTHRQNMKKRGKLTRKSQDNLILRSPSTLLPQRHATLDHTKIGPVGEEIKQGNNPFAHSGTMKPLS